MKTLNLAEANSVSGGDFDWNLYGQCVGERIGNVIDANVALAQAYVDGSILVVEELIKIGTDG